MNEGCVDGRERGKATVERERGLEGNVEDGSVVGWWGGWGWREGQRDGGRKEEETKLDVLFH